MPSFTAACAWVALNIHAKIRARTILFPAKRIKFSVDVMKHASAGQLLLVGVRAAELGPAEAKLLRRGEPGGVILFDRESTQLNPRHQLISYTVFFFEKKKKNNTHELT